MLLYLKQGMAQHESKIRSTEPQFPNNTTKLGGNEKKPALPAAGSSMQT